MTITDETKVGRRRGRRAIVRAAAVEAARELVVTGAGPEPVTAETSSGPASAPDMHGVTEDAGPDGEDKTANDVVVADIGSNRIQVGNGAPVGDGATGTDAPRETRRQRRRAKQRPATKAPASSPSTRLPASKNARIAELVSRPEGAGIDELTAVTGWQRHTVRAAITRLRQSGFTVELRTGEDGRRAYHHAANTEVVS